MSPDTTATVDTIRNECMEFHVRHVYDLLCSYGFEPYIVLGADTHRLFDDHTLAMAGVAFIDLTHGPILMETIGVYPYEDLYKCCWDCVGLAITLGCTARVRVPGHGFYTAVRDGVQLGSEIPGLKPKD